VSGIIRVHKDERYFHASNEPFNDASLSWEARGVMGYLLSKPDGWECRNSDLVANGPAGEDKVRRTIKELKDAGYIRRFKKRSEEGTFEWVTEVYESPSLNPSCQQTIKGLTTDGSTIRGSTTRGKPAHVVITESVSTEKAKTESVRTENANGGGGNAREGVRGDDPGGTPAHGSEVPPSATAAPSPIPPTPPPDDLRAVLDEVGATLDDPFDEAELAAMAEGARVRGLDGERVRVLWQEILADPECKAPAGFLKWTLTHEKGQGRPPRGNRRARASPAADRAAVWDAAFDTAVQNIREGVSPWQT